MNLPIITKKKFNQHLKKRPLENLGVIKDLEKDLKKRRGYVFKQPKKGDPVILLLSGGLDSVTSWEILLKEFGLKVYPLTLVKGGVRRLFEEESVQYFSKYYREKYPDLYQPPFSIDMSFNEISIPAEKAAQYLHPDFLIKKVNLHGKIMENLSFGSFTIAPLLAKMYARYLLATKNEKINTIYCAVTTNDGRDREVPEQTFTTLRAIMWFLATTTGQKNWQFTSAIFEKELGIYMSKADVVSWANEAGIPLEKTWSCYLGDKAGKHCGECLTCYDRKQAFIDAGVKDLTQYHDSSQGFLLTLKNTLVILKTRLKIFINSLN